MHISIKNELHTFEVEVKHSDCVAHVKALYQRSGKCPDCKSIVLMHKGKTLEDEQSLGEQGIAHNTQLIHMDATTQEPYHAINYQQLASTIAAKRQVEDEQLRRMQQENVWAPDEQGTVRSMGTDKSLVSTSPSCRPSPTKKNKTARVFFNEYSVSVDGSIFHVLPRMEGRWNGDIASVPGSDSDKQVCSDEMYFREAEGVWSQRQMTTNPMGISTTSHCWLKPVADGILKAETDDSSLRNCDITLREQGMHILLVTALSKQTNNVVLVETITLVDTHRRLRTVQRFDESGKVRFVLVMTENRVVDSVSGALEKYDEFSS